MEHTKEPWQVNQFDPTQVCDSDGDARGCAPVATMHGTAAENRANARRIVACVNALAGFTTEEIEAGVDLVKFKQQRDEWHREFKAAYKREAEALQQRDELLAALERIATSRVVDIAVTAIAKVKL